MVGGAVVSQTTRTKPAQTSMLKTVSLLLTTQTDYFETLENILKNTDQAGADIYAKDGSLELTMLTISLKLSP